MYKFSHDSLFPPKVNKSQQPVQQDSETARHRRISTASSAAATELESSSPEVSSVQNAFLDAMIAGNVMLRRLSPNIDDLLAGNVYDHGQYEQLLRVGFASPAFEQDVSLIIHFCTWLLMLLHFYQPI